MESRKKKRPPKNAKTSHLTKTPPIAAAIVKIKNLNDKGRDATLYGQYEEALRLLNQSSQEQDIARQLEPNNFELTHLKQKELLHRAEYYRTLRMTDESSVETKAAISECNKALARRPDDLESAKNKAYAMIQLAHRLDRSGKSAQATTIDSKIVNQFDNQQKTNRDDGEISYIKALALEGMAFTQASDEAKIPWYDRALEACLDGLSRSPKDLGLLRLQPLLLTTKGTIEAILKRPDDALVSLARSKSAIERAQLDYPKDIILFWREAAAYDAMGFPLSQIHKQTECLDTKKDAINAINAGLKEAPNSLDLLLQEAFILNSWSRFEGLEHMDVSARIHINEGLEVLDKIIKVVPKYAAAYETRGSLYRTMGDLKSSMDFDRAIPLQEIVKNYDKAIALGAQRAANYGARGTAQYKLAILSGRTKQLLSQAQTSLEMAIKLDPAYEPVYRDRLKHIDWLLHPNKKVSDDPDIQKMKKKLTGQDNN